MQSPCFRGLIPSIVLGFVATGLCGCGGGSGGGTTTTSTTTTTTPNTCLCVFDVDRTLTASQKLDCANTTVKQGITDPAYGGGTLKLSQLAPNINKTFCSRCYSGIVTRGEAGGNPGGHDSEERKLILGLVGGKEKTLSDEWQQWQAAPGKPSQDPAWNATSSMVFEVSDGFKNQCVESIVAWFLKSKGILIVPEKVHFFDDRADNIDCFKTTRYNAHQISCAARDPTKGMQNVGKCGATTEEIVESKGGVHSLCAAQQESEVIV
jgi:hypothetical protein